MKYEVVRRKKAKRNMTLADVEDGQAFKRLADCWYLRLGKHSDGCVSGWHLDRREIAIFPWNLDVVDVGDVEIDIIVEDK